mmetsp:Transcript_26534/g.64673  ORF Transcript_26534/g.64673 Transcript_26534/m.64673 type:complete len:277 (+) Transcript_26534:1675-2505(+)
MYVSMSSEFKTHSEEPSQIVFLQFRRFHSIFLIHAVGSTQSYILSSPSSLPPPLFPWLFPPPPPPNPNPPSPMESISRLAAKASFLSQAKKACAASVRSKPISVRRSTAAISSSLNLKTCWPPPPPPMPPPKPPPCAACIMYCCSCSGGICPSICAVALSCSGDRPIMAAISFKSLGLISCSICAICAGFAIPSKRSAGKPPPAPDGADDDDGAGAGADDEDDDSVIGSFISAKNASWFALISARSSGCCCPIWVKTVCSIWGFDCTKRRRSLNCG